MKVIVKWNEKYYKVSQTKRTEFYDNELNGYRYRYKVLVETESEDRVFFDFHDSIAHYEEGKNKLTENELVCALYYFLTDGEAWLSHRNIDDFADEFGYKVSKAIKVYEGCNKAYDKIHDKLGLSDDELYEFINYLQETYDL